MIFELLVYLVCQGLFYNLVVNNYWYIITQQQRILSVCYYCCKNPRIFLNDVVLFVLFRYYIELFRIFCGAHVSLRIAFDEIKGFARYFLRKTSTKEKSFKIRSVLCAPPKK